MFETEHFTNAQMGALVYTIPVTSTGMYEMVLVLGESWHPSVSTRLFDVSMQGTLVYASLSIYSRGGHLLPLLLTKCVTVDGLLSIEITLDAVASAPEGPTISGLIVTKVAELGAPSPTLPPSTEVALYRINCGGPSVIDSNGNVWLTEDTLGQTIGGNVVRPSDLLPGLTYAATPYTVPLASILETERWSSPSIGSVGYRFGELQPGTYTVKMLFVETWHPDPGERVFNVHPGSARRGEP